MICLSVSAASPFGEGPQPQYSIDNLPKTSFTCEDKPKDGLYADVETQCQVFHLCRTISGELTLESSFVCPPGTVFNQPEGNCDAWKEVECELYSAPEHSFEKTPATGTRNLGSKVRNKRHTIKNVENIKLGTVKSPKIEIVYKLGESKNCRLKRETTKETFEYDYVDDNYEAHAAKPINRDVSSQNNKMKQSDGDIASVKDHDGDDYYDYDSVGVSSGKGAKAEPYLLESQRDEIDGQEDVVPTGKVSTDSDRSSKASEGSVA